MYAIIYVLITVAMLTYTKFKVKGQFHDDWFAVTVYVGCLQSVVFGLGYLIYALYMLKPL